MIYVVEKVRLDVPVAVAWEWLADLEWLATVGVFHHRARFVGERRQGVGTRLILEHRLIAGPVFPRLLRVTHWDEQRRVRWTEIDPHLTRYLFPHSQQFLLEPLGAAATLLTDEVRGTFNLPLLRDPTDKLAEWLTVRRAVRLECAHFRRRARGTG